VSTVSAMSLNSYGRPASSITSVGSTDTQRRVPPAFDMAKLPPLPPTRREREEQAANMAANTVAAKAPLVAVSILAFNCSGCVSE
jgi:hypothetical protein